MGWGRNEGGQGGNKGGWGRDDDRWLAESYNDHFIISALSRWPFYHKGLSS